MRVREVEKPVPIDSLYPITEGGRILMAQLKYKLLAGMQETLSSSAHFLGHFPSPGAGL